MARYKICFIIILFFILVSITGFCSCQFVSAEEVGFQITLRYQGRAYVYDFNENIPEISNFRDSQMLQKNNRLASIEKRAQKIDQIVSIGFSQIQAFDYMLFGFENFYNNIKQDIEREERSAEIKFRPNSVEKFQITPEQNGVKLNDDVVLGLILEQMRRGQNVDVQLKPKVTIPKLTQKELSSWTRKLSSFSTNYENSTDSRKHNVRKALGMFDGMIIEPNQEVSFNTTTGRRTLENGYKEAKIIQDKEYVEAYGGGVCQSSTTLYNALILAGVEIREVHPHSLAPNYIEYGFDAMVNYGTSDLRFRNTSEAPIFIHTTYTDKIVTAEVYGKGLDNYTRKRVSEVLEKIPPESEKVILDTNQEFADKVIFEDEEWYQVYPKNGYKARGYIEYYDGDKLLNKKKIREVKYYPVRGVKIKGTKVREPKVLEESENIISWNTLDKLLA